MYNNILVNFIPFYLISDSSADPLLDEHFRRALGEKNYESIFNNKKGEAVTSEPKSPPISSSSNADHLSRPTAYSPPSYLHSSTANEASLRASRIDHHGPRSPIHSSSLNSSSSSITSSEISVTRITPKSSPVGKGEQAPYPSEVDVDPVKAFQDDMKLEDEGYTGTIFQKYTNSNIRNLLKELKQYIYSTN